MRLFLGFTFLLSWVSIVAQSNKIWTLDSCLNYAYQKNIDVQRALLQEKASNLTLKTAKNHHLPTVNGGVSQNFTFGRALSSSNTYVSQNTHTTGFSLQLSVPIFNGFQTSSQIKVAEWNLKASEAEVEKTKEALSIAIMQSYLQVLYEKEVVESAQKQLLLSQQQKLRFDSLLSVGKIAPYEVIRIKATLANDELNVTQAQNAYKIALLELSQLLELPSFETLQIQPLNDTTLIPFTLNFENVFQEALPKQATIQAEKFRLESAKEQIKTARGGYLPKLNFSVGLSTNYYYLEGGNNPYFSKQLDRNLSKFLGFSLNIPIFDAFTTKNQIKQAKLNYLEQRLQADLAQKNFYKILQQAYYNALNAYAKYTSSKVAEENAFTAFELANKKYLYGKAEITEYNEAKTTWEKIQISTLQAKYEYLLRCKIFDFYRKK